VKVLLILQEQIIIEIIFLIISPISIVITPHYYLSMDRGDKDSKGNDEENRQGRRPRRERQEEPERKNVDDTPIRNEEQLGANGKPRRRRGAAEEDDEADGKTGWMSSAGKDPEEEEDAM